MTFLSFIGLNMLKKCVWLKNPSFREGECKDLSRSKEEAKCHYCIVSLAVFKVSVARFSIFNYHFWIVSRLLENGAPFPESCCSLFHLFSSWSSTRYCSSLTCRKKRTVIIIAANFLHNSMQYAIVFISSHPPPSPLSPETQQNKRSGETWHYLTVLYLFDHIQVSVG